MRISGALAAAILFISGVVFFVRPDLAHQLAGYKPLTPPGPEQIDHPPPFDEGAAMRFFAERNAVELTLPRDMTVAEVLRLYQIDFPHVRRQISEQREGGTTVRDRDVLKRGERYLLTLTPPAEGLP